MDTILSKDKDFRTEVAEEFRSEATKSDAQTGDLLKGMRLFVDELNTLEQKVESAIKNAEKDADPTGIGFAFGGVHPGWLHAHGKAVETHAVS